MSSSLPSKKNDEFRGKKRRAEVNDADSTDAAVEKKLCSAKDLCLSQLAEAKQKGSYWVVDFWKKTPLDWQRDRDFAMTVLKYSVKVCKHLPTVLLEDREFLLRAVHQNSWMWEALPPTVQQDVEFIREISFYTDSLAVCGIFKKVPLFANERVVWMAALDSDFSDRKIDYLLKTFAPTSILSDSEIMSKACSLSVRAFGLVSETLNPLNKNKEFIRGVLAANALVLWRIPPGTQLLFPDLIVDAVPCALRKFDAKKTPLTLLKQHSIFVEKISTELWKTNRDVVRAWFLGGGYFFSGSNHTRMKNLKDDRELFLLLAANFRRDYPQGLIESFRQASNTLRNDKKFMLNAIEHNPNVFVVACDELREDFDLFLAAFGGTAGEYPWISRKTFEVIRDGITRFIPRVEEELKKYQEFVKTIGYGIMLQQVASNSSGSPLSLLNQGEATASNYKRRIAEYLDVPIGLQLKMLLNVQQNCTSILVKFMDLLRS